MKEIFLSCCLFFPYFFQKTAAVFYLPESEILIESSGNVGKCGSRSQTAAFRRRAVDQQGNVFPRMIGMLPVQRVASVIRCYYKNVFFSHGFLYRREVRIEFPESPVITFRIPAVSIETVEIYQVRENESVSFHALKRNNRPFETVGVSFGMDLPGCSPVRKNVADFSDPDDLHSL